MLNKRNTKKRKVDTGCKKKKKKENHSQERKTNEKWMFLVVNTESVTGGLKETKREQLVLQYVDELFDK